MPYDGQKEMEIIVFGLIFIENLRKKRRRFELSCVMLPLSVSSLSLFSPLGFPHTTFHVEYL